MNLHVCVCVCVCLFSCDTQISRGIESLYNKLRSEFEEPSPTEPTSAVECDDLKRLSLCSTHLHQMAVSLADQPFFREILPKLQCTLFQVSQSMPTTPVTVIRKADWSKTGHIVSIFS